MKKLVFLLLALSLLITSCGQTLPEPEQENQHVHSWDDGVVDTPATCTTDGKMVFTCSKCGEKKTEPIPADGTTHTFSTAWTTDENQHWHAATCGHDVTVTKEDHDWVDELITEGSCTTDREVSHACSVCGYGNVETTPKEEYHQFNTSTHTCEICGAVSYFQASFESNKVCVILRAKFINAGLTDLIIPEYVYNYDYEWYDRPEVLKSVNTATMTSLTLPESITTIGYQALKDKTNLQVVNLPESLTTIEQEAFMSCTGIETLYIPASVTFIGAQALAYCSNLTTINFGGTRDQWTSLMSGAKNIMKSTPATVHCSDD